MAEARHDLMHHHGGQNTLFVEAERLEWQSGNGEPHFLWDVQGWYGGDRDKVWVKTEGEVSLDGGGLEEAEIQLLYSRAISPFFDLQAGVRRDIEPDPARTYGVIGIQGLVPHFFEVDAAAFVSNKGDVSARIEAEYEVLLTQRLILQPRTELEFAVQNVPELGVGSGLSSATVGMRLRYEIKREFAPYIGVSWKRVVGETADLTRADGEDVESVSLVAGLRIWF
jgi:copper resistance protein B